MSASREWQIDQRVKVLIGRLMAGSATPQDEVEYDMLVAERCRRMRPGASKARYRRAA